MKNFLGESIRFLRLREHLSAAGVSKQAGLSSSYVTKVERGDIIPSVSAFSKIISVLHPTDTEILCIIRALGVEVDE